MEINLSYDQAFTDKINSLIEKYGDEIMTIEGLGDNLDIVRFSKKFFTNNTNTVADSSIDENANVSDNCVISYKKEASKPLYKLNSLYILWRMLRKTYNTSVANDILEKQINGEIYCHDLHMFMLAYCFNYSTLDIVYNGLPMVNKIKSIPPKHLRSFKSQIEQFIVIASNSTNGATGIADILVVMAYYVSNIYKTGKDSGTYFAGWFSDHDNTDTIRSTPHNYEMFDINVKQYIKETLSSLIYTLNQPMRADQSAFTNISIYDDIFLDKTIELYTFPDGSTPNKEIVKMIQTLFLDAMNEELSRTVFTFPVTTACFAIDDDKNILDEDFANYIAEHNKKFGFINIFIGKSSVLSSCCRLVSDTENEYFNSIGGSSSKIGSLNVVTINLPRLAKRFNKESVFLDELEKLVQITGKINNCKRKIISQKIDEGFMPLYTHGFMDLNKQYSTTGINGFYEALTYLGYDITTKEGQKFAIEMMKVINNIVDNMQRKFKAPHNIEQVPAEGSSSKLAKKDKLLGYNDNLPLYSNQFIPLTANADLLDRIKIQGKLDEHFSGGSIMHVNVESEVSEEQTVELIKTCAKLGVRYFGINYHLNECENGHITIGHKDRCEICKGKITDSFARVVGFIVSTKNFAKSRREHDYPNRKFYDSI